MSKIPYHIIRDANNRKVAKLKKIAVIVMIVFCVKAMAEDVGERCKNADDEYQCHLDSLNIERNEEKCFHLKHKDQLRCLAELSEWERIDVRCKDARDKFGCLINQRPSPIYAIPDFFIAAFFEAGKRAYSCKSYKETAVFFDNVANARYSGYFDGELLEYIHEAIGGLCVENSQCLTKTYEMVDRNASELIIDVLGNAQYVLDSNNNFADIKESEMGEEWLMEINGYKAKVKCRDELLSRAKRKEM
jgi:hypothetical protein